MILSCAYAQDTKGEGLPLFVSMEFQFYFTSLIGMLFTFPSRY